MKPKYLVILASILLPGCATVLEQTVYLQNVKVVGPLHSPPMTIIDTLSFNKVIFSPRIYINPSNELRSNLDHSKVNSSGVYQLDTLRNNGDITYKESALNVHDFKGDNLYWTFPKFSGGLDMQIPMGKSTHLNAGLSYSNYNNIGLMGGNIGFTFFTTRQVMNASFSIGLHAQEMYYDALTIVKTTVKEGWSGDTHTDIFLYHDIDKDYAINLYATFMLNYFYNDIGFNFPFSFFTQEALNFEPKAYNRYYYNILPVNNYDARISHFATFVAASPGMYKYVAENMRLAGNINIVYEIGNLGINNSSLIIFPTFKIDFLF